LVETYRVGLAARWLFLLPVFGAVHGLSLPQVHANEYGIYLRKQGFKVSIVHRLERGSAVLYPVMIAVGLALLAGANLVTHPGGRMAVFACSLASFVVAAIAALADGGVFH
jgi:hypothetical protein